MSSKIQIKRGTTEQWASSTQDTTLAPGQLGIEYLTSGYSRIKAGTDDENHTSTEWADLNYLSPSPQIYQDDKIISLEDSFTISESTATTVLSVTSSNVSISGSPLSMENELISNLKEPESNTDAATKQYVDNKLNLGIESIFDIIYPVGSIYISTVFADASVYAPDPGLGLCPLDYGTWERFAEGRTLVGAPTYSHGDFSPLSEQTGGSNTCTLTTANLPSHTHTISVEGSGDLNTWSQNTNHTHTVSGGSHIHNFQGYRYKSHDSSGTDHVMSNEVLSGDPVSTASMLVSGSHTHTVSVESVNHKHTITSHTHSATASSVGNGESFSIVQSYITVYFWKRIS